MSSLQPSRSDPSAVDSFLKRVLKTGLLDLAQLQETLRDVPREQRDDASAVADHLVRKGKLSRFQANKILRGSGRGLLLNHYQVLAPIGRGGMSTVYLARDERSGILVALKLLTPDRWRKQERLLARFQREMELSQRVAHPHLAWTYESGLCLDVHYIAMEYIAGKNLARVIADEGPMPVARAAHLLAEVASGLEYAHNQGLIHRDMKPSNIMVTPNDHAKVLDLGLALMLGEEAEETVLGGSSYIVGTMDYIAPEQTTDAAGVDGRADIYSLGCTLYFALTGQPPFPGGSSRDKIRRHRHDTPPPLRLLEPSVPPGFAQLIERMMAKEVSLRPASAAEVEEQLRAWATGETVLPLDRPDDATYAQSIAALQSAEPSAEYSLPNLALPDSEYQTETNQRRAARTKLLLLAVVLVLGGTVLLTTLLVLVAVLSGGR